MNQHSAAHVTTPPLRIGPDDTGRRMTLEEFFAADTEEGFRFELIRERLVVLSAPNRPHQRLLGWIRDILTGYRRQRPDVFNDVSGPARLILSEPTDEVSAPEPDLVCYRDYPADVPEGESTWDLGTPILAVEIVSQDNADKDLVRNPELYLQVVTMREYWIIDPRESYERPSIIVYRRRGQNWQKPIHVPAGGSYTTRLLPDFSLALDRSARGSQP